jgi:hypothetical protein
VNFAFNRREAYALGITRRQLQSPAWRRLAKGVYARSDIAEAPLVKLHAALHRAPSIGILSGHTAAWLHGIESNLSEPIEVTLPPMTPTSRLTALSIRRATVHPDEVVLVKGLPATTPLRTVADLGRRPPLIDAVALIDVALHRGVISADPLQVWASAHRGYRGVAILRRAIELSDARSESVMETRLRLLLVLAGLPRPEVQVSLYDDTGMFIARVDLLYPRKRLVLEYDGVTHRRSLASDNRRQNRLIEAGYTILRFTASDVLHAPAGVVAKVQRVLASLSRFER